MVKRRWTKSMLRRVMVTPRMTTWTGMA